MSGVEQAVGVVAEHHYETSYVSYVTNQRNRLPAALNLITWILLILTNIHSFTSLYFPQYNVKLRQKPARSARGDVMQREEAACECHPLLRLSTALTDAQEVWWI